MTLDELKTEFRVTNDGDNWGNAMAWLFAVAETLHFERDAEVPSEWEFRPSPFGMSTDPESYEYGCVTEADDETLLTFGAILHRLCAILDKRGESY